LRNRDIRWVADQQDHFLVPIQRLPVPLLRIILEIVVVREEDPGNRRDLVVQVIEGQQVPLRQSIPHLIDPRQHYPQPGAAALAE
jgi:hypothetical protein